jgi:trimethylguanosine synthase
MDSQAENQTSAVSSTYAFSPADRLPLSDLCHHYQHKSEVPWDIQKCVYSTTKSSSSFHVLTASRYFSQRYSIFSWYDEGICMTDDAWFGVTPEPVAK